MVYRFAKGLPVNYLGLGNRVRIDRPRDFLVVTGHAPVGAGAPRDTRRFQETAWALFVGVAERNNEPGVFTIIIGWEWSGSSPPGSSNLHRVVFTPADVATAKRFLPILPRDSRRPEDLWNWLDETSNRLGIDFVAIPHNSNISSGLMFDMVDSNGRPVSAEYARARMRWEPVAEVLQVKGASEAHPFLSPEDEFAGYEVYGFVLGRGMDPILGGPGGPGGPGGYLRTALLRGLQIGGAVGSEPGGAPGWVRHSHWCV